MWLASVRFSRCGDNITRISLMLHKFVAVYCRKLRRFARRLWNSDTCSSLCYWFHVTKVTLSELCFKYPESRTGTNLSSLNKLKYRRRSTRAFRKWSAAHNVLNLRTCNTILVTVHTCAYVMPSQVCCRLGRCAVSVAVARSCRSSHGKCSSR